MTHDFAIRETTPSDLALVLALYPQAFPEEELRPLVSALIEEQSRVLSLAAFDGDALVAHILFTMCGTAKSDRGGALLGPLGVMPSHQRQGLGSSLVRAGLERLREDGVRQAFVLGDPAYYDRFGFVRERRVRTPYPIPEEWAEAWRSLALATGAPIAPGRMSLPEPWMNAALWGP